MIARIRETAKRFARWGLNSCAASDDSVPILAGPLKGSRLPGETALNNFAMMIGQYEPEVVSELCSLREKPVVAYDVGAHVGLITLAMAMSAKRVFAFEPITENRDLIEKLVDQNGLRGIVRIIPLALGNANGQQRMFNFGSSSMHLLEAALDEQDVRDCTSRYVPLSTLDSFVFEQRNAPPDLLKIDVEGAESHVLEGGFTTLKEFRPTLIIEIHGPKNAAKTWDLLEKLAYTWWHLATSQKTSVARRSDSLSLFSKDTWTQHFLLLPMGGNH